MSHSLRGSVDWNHHTQIALTGNVRHSLRGSVDWNIRVICSIILIAVTPYAGVWIEIGSSNDSKVNASVTPYAGVWIEIFKINIIYYNTLSLPTRECGLKLQYCMKRICTIWSLPTRECGLKFNNTPELIDTIQSLPTRECGLKLLFNKAIKREEKVTPYAGVWIEIIHYGYLNYINIGHSLRGSVDWNIRWNVYLWKCKVTPYAGVWIEIFKECDVNVSTMSLPTRECGLK